MSSMVSKSHIKLQDLAPFLRGYDSKSPESAQDWAKGQSTGFAPGMLIFCLEKVAAAPGLAVGRKDDAGDSYRVRDLCIVVGEDGGRPLVVNITASAYELRFLEVLMYEKAKKAILDEKDFSFAAVRPVKKLEKSKVEEIEQLGAVYAQGGSRRSLVVDSTAPQEPAMALLSSLGVKLTMIGIGKQALDIGYVCLLLFGPEGRVEDKNRAQVRSAFAPVPVTEKLGTTVTTPEPPQAATVWQGPLPSGDVQVPPGSESLLAGGHETISVEKEEGDPGWGSTNFDEEWSTPSTPQSTPQSTPLSTPPSIPQSTQPSTPAALPAATASEKSSQYSFTPPAGTPPAASWQPPATQVPDFAFAPQPASTFPTPGGSDFQEELSHKTEFEQHLNVGGVGASAVDKKSSWDDDAPPSSWAQPPAPPAEPDTWQPASPSAISSEWTAPSSSSTPVSDWSAPPAPPSPDWNKPTIPSSGDWGAAPGPGDAGWEPPPTPPKPTITTGDWGSQPTTGAFEKNDSGSAAAQSQSGSWANAAPPAGTTAGTGAWNTPWAHGGDPDASGAPQSSSAEGASPGSEHASDAEGGAVPKKDANLFNRLYQQLAKGSPSASATNLPQMDREGSLRADEGAPNAAQSNLPRLSQELLSRTTAPQSPNASSTNLQPMDPELAAHFRIPSPPPGATPDATVALTPGQSAPQVVSVPEPAAPAADTPTFDWGAAANESSKSAENKSGDESSAESGNEAPSWLESLDRKKAAPYSTATNLKPPSTNPTPKKGSTSRVGSASGDFELVEQPADIEMLRETGKIKMTPSMKDTVRRRSVEAAAKQVAEQQQQKNEAAPTLNAPASPAKRVGDRPAEKVEPAESTKTSEPAEVVEVAEAAPPGQSTKPKSEDAYKHLAEALSGLMAGDDDQNEARSAKSEAARAAASKEADDDGVAMASQNLSANFKLTKTAEDLEVAPSDSVVDKKADKEPVSSQQGYLTDAISPVVPSRFAAMEAALSQPATTPIKPLSIDSSSSVTPIPVTAPIITPAAAATSYSDAPISATLHDIETVESDEHASTDSVTEHEEEPASTSTETSLTEPDAPVAAFLDKDTNFLVTTRTDMPALEDALELSSAAAALDPNLLITSASDIPSLPTQLAAAAATADSAASAKAARATTFQEPRLVMNEMVTLMNKLEQQVGKAAKKVSSRSEDIKQRLNKQVDDLIAAASQVENQNQVVVQETTAKLSKSLDSSTDEARQNISDLAAGGRYSIKQMLTTNHQAVDDTKAKLLNDLTKACDEFRKESESLTQECENYLAQFVKDKTDLIDVNLKDITERLDETNASFLAKITARFERFKERMSDEASSIGRSLERNVHSMFEEIDGSWDRASEKLKLTKSEFEQTILHSVKTVELSASQNTRQILISSMAPQLRERTRRLLDLKDSQTKQFMSDTVAQSSLQLQGLESSLAAARQQLHTLVEDCVSNLDGVGRGQQAGLEEIFKSASGKTEKLTSEVQLAIQDAQSRVQENEIICKKLAENSSVDTDVELTDERAATTQAIQKLKGQCNSQIQTALEDACMRLEQMSQKVQNEATNYRMQQTQDARENSEAGLNKIREAIQEAFSAIQSAREQNME
jgi:hypothetical protein